MPEILLTESHKLTYNKTHEHKSEPQYFRSIKVEVTGTSSLTAAWRCIPKWPLFIANGSAVKISELIKHLEKYPSDWQVKVYDGACGLCYVNSIFGNDERIDCNEKKHEAHVLLSIWHAGRDCDR